MKYKEAREKGLCGSCMKTRPRDGKATCAACARRSDEARRLRIYRKVNLMLAIEAYGGKCACCGETNPMFLTLDHKNNDGNKHRKELSKISTSSYRGDAIYRWARREGWPNMFQLLCFNCNLGKARNGGSCPHVTVENGRVIKVK